MHIPPKILIVDDEPFNVDYLEQELEDYGYVLVTATNGQEALEQVTAENPDIVLLDIMMPIMDGFEVLTKMKSDKQLRHIPVIIISAIDDIDSVVRGIELGADDYLAKPFNEILLAARITAGLERKRLRDNEREYLQQVTHLTNAALAVEADTFRPEMLDRVAHRDDELGGLARVFQNMAERIHLREQQLRHQINQLQADITEEYTAVTDLVAHYVPMDQRQALVRQQTLPSDTEGVALFADVSGYTRLTQALVIEFGDKRGAEEMLRIVNQVYHALIEQIHRYHGSVIGFSGDAITCWFDVSSGDLNTLLQRAIVAAQSMQGAMEPFKDMVIGTSFPISLSIKVSLAAGTVKRFLVGQPDFQVFDVIAGDPVTDLAIGEQLAQRGDIILTQEIAESLGEAITIKETKITDNKTFVLVDEVLVEIAPYPWEDLTMPQSMDDTIFQPWLTPMMYEHIKTGKSSNLSQFRETTALFITFSGIDYEHDAASGEHLNQFVQWVQTIITQYDGKVVQVTVGDKANYIYAVFGAPIAQPRHALSAVKAALDLQTDMPFDLPIHDIRIGITSGIMRSGAYGGSHRRTYGNQGAQTNLAARLMGVAESILVDQTVYTLTNQDVQYELLDPITVKSYTQPIKIYRPIKAHDHLKVDFRTMVDLLAPDEQMLLQLMSVFDRPITLEILQAVHPDNHTLLTMQPILRTLTEQNFILWHDDGSTIALAHPKLQQVVYEAMLFAQRRQFHRTIAHWIEDEFYDDLENHFDDLIYHWDGAEDFSKIIDYLERAADHAKAQNNTQQARAYYEESLKRRSQS